MGHEYLEMKNSHAAIEAYRRGVGAHLGAEWMSSNHTNYLTRY